MIAEIASMKIVLNLNLQELNIYRKDLPFYKQIHKIVSFIAAFMFVSTAVAQETKEEETIDTEHVVIIKAYTPTISDAFKIKSAPVIEDLISQEKKQVDYSINSVPVASTFKPKKGKAVNLEKPKPIDTYDSYATVGVGNYNTILADFYSNFRLSRSDALGINLHHTSSQGGIKDIILDDKYYNSFVDLDYSSRTRDYTFGLEAGAEHMLYNWYGLPKTPVLSPAELGAIDPQQNYYGFKFGMNYYNDDSILKNATAKYRFFGDVMDSKEHHIVLKPTLEFEIGDNTITTTLIGDFLKGSFVRPNYQSGFDPSMYSIMNVGVNPNLVVLRDNLTLNLGLTLYGSFDTQNRKVFIKVYPKVNASYSLLDEMLIGYAGLEGDLEQNTYRDAVLENQYVSPTLLLKPTNRLFNFHLGFKGKLSDVVSYNIRGSYSSEVDKALFLNNAISTTNPEGFDYGNSFSYLYNDIDTMTGFGELNFEINKKFRLGGSITYLKYNSKNNQEAWNLPQLKAGATLDYQISKKWYMGAQVYYVGERMDIDAQNSTVTSLPITTITLDEYIDANVNFGYRLNERLSFFIKGNNLIGNNYQRWVNFPVQGLQFMGGVTYKFDY